MDNAALEAGEISTSNAAEEAMMMVEDTTIIEAVGEPAMIPTWTPPAPADVDFTKPVEAYIHASAPFKVSNERD